jgi:hypothetical protein
MNNIGNALRDAVLGTRAARSIADGSLGKENYRQYMADVYCYALHSAQVIAAAGSRLVLSHPPLADYLLDHSREELGHDRWASRDLVDLGLNESQIAALNPSDPCQKMIGLEYYFAHHGNPIGLFGWMLALEGLGGQIGGSMAKGIDACLNLNGKGVYFLAGHGEADTHHSADLLEVSDKHITDPGDRALVGRVGRLARDCYVGILENCYMNPLPA